MDFFVTFVIYFVSFVVKKNSKREPQSTRRENTTLRTPRIPVSKEPKTFPNQTGCKCIRKFFKKILILSEEPCLGGVLCFV